MNGDPSARGRFVVLEGVDGCGKSTQARALCMALAAAGRPVRHLRDPGSTPLGERLRALLLAESTGPISAASEALLFTAARVELARSLIEPALTAGETVVCERFVPSTLVYQGSLGGVDRDWIAAVNRHALRGLDPDRIVVLDVTPEVTAQRRTERGGADRIEARGEAFQRRVRGAFLALADAEPDAYRVLDAGGEPASVTRALLQALADLFPELATR